MATSSSPVLITGVGKRIGYALCQYFIHRGVPVIGTYRTDYGTFDKLTGADLIYCDLYQQKDLDHLIDHLKRNYRGLRAVIHNASDWVAESSGLPPQEIFSKMMQIHAGVPYQLNLALRTLLESSGTASDIIHITDYIVEKGSKKHIAYAASKAAMSNMTMSFSALLAPNIKVNAIAPSLILFNHDDSDEYKEKALNQSLLKITPGEEEMVTAVDYILKSSYMTGRILSLDGGRHVK